MPRLLLLPLLFLLGCGGRPDVRGSGTLVAETRPVGPFRFVHLSGFADLHVTVGQPASVEVQAEDNIQPFLTVATTPDGTLELGYVPGASVRPRKMVTFRVTLPHLDGLAKAGVGTVRVAGPLTGRVEVSAAGGGDVILEQVAADELILRRQGEGGTEATGTAGRLRLLVQGGPGAMTAELKGLTAGRADLDIDTAAAAVRVTDALTVITRRNGEVRYRGTPAVTVAGGDPGRVRAE